MGEGLSKVNKLNVTFDNPSLFSSHACIGNKKNYNLFFCKYGLFPARKFIFADSFKYSDRNCFCIIHKQIR